MTVAVPVSPSIYHIVHVDRLASIVSDGYLWCDTESRRRRSPGTVIGMSEIKNRRRERVLNSRPGLRVGGCVPFYFCPRSVMLYLIHMANHPALACGQDPIVHLEADLNETVAWAERNQRRWAFTCSNAAADYSGDRCDLTQLEEIDSVQAMNWGSCKNEKQAEFLTLIPMGACPASRGMLAEHATTRLDGCADAPSPPACRSYPSVVLLSWETTEMIRFKSGDILAEDVEALVNTVNCVGVTGRGVALQFKKAFPDNFKAYAAACKRKEVIPGRMFVFETGTLAPRYIVNFPTKRHWRTKSRMADVEAGLEALAAEIDARNIGSIAIPPLACGLGGLAWDDVRPRIEAALAGFVDLQVTVFQPDGASEAKDMTYMRKVPEMTPGRAVLVGLIRRYLDAMLDPFVTLLEAHKLMYFMQEAGEQLRLRYVKAPCGPYADNLRHVLNEIEGHFISGYADGGDDPERPLDLIPGAIEDAEAVLERKGETRTRFERVAELVYGFESSFGLELLATVHWVMKREVAEPIVDVVARTHNWHERKRRFTPRQIALAATRLREKGWIAAAPPVP